MMPRDPSFFRTRVLREAKRMQGAASVEAQIAHHGMLSAYVDHAARSPIPSTIVRIARRHRCAGRSRKRIARRAVTAIPPGPTARSIRICVDCVDRAALPELQ